MNMKKFHLPLAFRTCAACSNVWDKPRKTIRRATVSTSQPFGFKFQKHNSCQDYPPTYVITLDAKFHKLKQQLNMLKTAFIYGKRTPYSFFLFNWSPINNEIVIESRFYFSQYRLLQYKG